MVRYVPGWACPNSRAKVTSNSRENDTNNEQNRAKLKKRKEEARKSALKQAKRDNVEFKNNLKPILIKSKIKTFRRHSRLVP